MEMRLTPQNDELLEITLTGSDEELKALGECLIMKSKHKDNFSLTYTGIPNVKLHIECDGSAMLKKFGIIG